MIANRCIAIALACMASATLAQGNTQQYDGWADFPTYPVELGPSPNALLGDRPSQGNSAADPIYVRNASSETMWVGFRAREGGAPGRAVCVDPRSDTRVDIGAGPWSVRVIAFGPDCIVTPQQKCNVGAQVQTRAIQIGGGPNPCEVRDIPPPPPGFKSAGGGPNLTTRNDAPMPIWVTIYRPGGTNRVIIASGCVLPGAEARWTARPHLQMQNFWVRAEYMGRRGNCAQPPRPSCDTTMQLRAWKYRNHIDNYRVSFKSAGNCWWDNPYQ